MPIKLYMIEYSPPCRGVIMTAQHLGVELNHEKMDYFAGDLTKPEFVKINPQHIVPTIDDDGFILWESRAIQIYLVNKYAPDSPIYPKDLKERAIVDRMLFFDIGTLYKAETDYCFPFMFMGKPEDPEKLEAFRKALALLEEFLGNTPYVAGNHITLADFSILASLSFIEVIDFSFSEYPKVSAWMKKMKSEIPNYKQIVEVSNEELKEWLKSQK